MRYNVTILTRKEEEAIALAVETLEKLPVKDDELRDAIDTLVSLRSKSLNNRK